MAQETIRLGFVGAGKFTRSRLLPNFQTTPDVELIAVSNSTQESGQRVAQEFGFGEVMSDWRTLVTLPGIDAVVIGTQAPLHAAIAIAALDAGKHVFTMNAMSTSLEEARAMLQKARENPHLTAMVFPSGFFLGKNAYMSRLMADGYVGQVLQVFQVWHTPFFGLGNQYELARRWFGEHSRIFAHRKALDAEIAGRGGQATPALANTVLAELAGGGVIAYLHVPIARQAGEARIEVYGTQGALVCYPQRPAQDAVYGAPLGEELRPLPMPPEYEVAWKDPRKDPVEADFIAAVRDGTPPSTNVPTFEDGVTVMEFAEALRLSTEHEGWVDLPLQTG